MAEALELEDFEVTVFHNAVEALEKIEEIPFDAVISDHHMPGMNGDKFFEKVNEIIDRDILFYLCTGDMDIDSDSFEAKGGTKVVMKPYNVFELCEEIKEKLA